MSSNPVAFSISVARAAMTGVFRSALRALHTLLFAGMAMVSATASCQEQVSIAPLAGSRHVSFASDDRRTGEPVMLSGWWLPSSIAGARPTVVALHGCGGLYGSRKYQPEELSARHGAMGNLLHEAGYNVLFPDSFTARGKRSICSEKIGARDLTSANRRDDVQGALTWLATQAEVDPSRIALLGWSHGGSTVLSSINVSRSTAPTEPVQPKAAVAFYPGCSASLGGKTPYRHVAPLLILMGENDDWTPAAPCIELEKRLATRGAPTTLRLYPDSYHDFDAPGMALRVRRDVPNGVNPGEGVTTGENAAARAAAYKEMLAFLALHLQ